MWNLVRCGRTEEAQKFCRVKKQYWRAATLAGAEYLHKAAQLEVENRHMPEPNVMDNSNRAIYYETVWRLSEEVLYILYYILRS
jgi:hypothetical protein